MVLLDGKTPVTVLFNNGILAQVTNGEETITVFKSRLSFDPNYSADA